MEGRRGEMGHGVKVGEGGRVPCFWREEVVVSVRVLGLWGEWRRRR